MYDSDDDDEDGDDEDGDDEDCDEEEYISPPHQKEEQKRLRAEELEDSTAEREWTTSKVFMQEIAFSMKLDKYN